MLNVVDMLESARTQCGLTVVAFMEKLQLPKPDQTRYSRVVGGYASVPHIWRPQIAKFLELPSEGEICWSKPKANTERALSAEELRELAKIVEVAGKPLTLTTLVRLMAEIKAAQK